MTLANNWVVCRKCEDTFTFHYQTRGGGILLLKNLLVPPSQNVSHGHEVQVCKNVICYTQGVRIHSTPRIHSFSNWGVGVVHSFFRVVFGVGVNPYNFSIHSTTPFIEKYLEFAPLITQKLFKTE